jgi:DNA end-binding protein Ku
VRLREAEVEMAKTLIENLSAPFDPEKYTDTYRKELLDLIRAKAKGKELPEREVVEEEPVDLMTALRESIERTQKSRSSRRKSSSRKSSSGTRKKASSRK